MRTRFTLLILLCSSVMGAASFFSLLYYFDPYINVGLAVILIMMSFILMMVSFLTLVLYFIKKIYYRGAIGMFNLISSMRQSFLFVLAMLGVIIGKSYSIPIILPLIILVIILIFIELFFQTLVK